MFLERSGIFHVASSTSVLQSNYFSTVFCGVLFDKPCLRCLMYKTETTFKEMHATAPEKRATYTSNKHVKLCDLTQLL